VALLAQWTFPSDRRLYWNCYYSLAMVAISVLC